MSLRRALSGRGEGGVLRRIVGENLARYRWRYAAAAACLVLIAGTTAFSAWLMGPIVDEVFIGRDLSVAYGFAGLVAGVFVLRGVVTYVQGVQLAAIGNNIVASYQRRIYDKLTALGLDFHGRQHSAFLVGRINQNISGVRALLNTLVVSTLRDALSLVGLVAVMFWSDWIMSLAVFSVGPLVAVLLSRYSRRVKGLARQEVNLNADVTLAMQETAAGIAVVKAFTMEDRLRGRLHELTRRAEERANAIARITERTSPLMETIAGLSVATVIAYGGWRVIEGGMNAGALTAFMTALLMAYEPAKRLAKLKVVLERSLVNARMIYEILDEPVGQSDRFGARTLELAEGTIEFDDVRFSYPGTNPGTNGGTEGDAPTIDGMSFTAPAGQTTALVGPSGGGKTTAIALVQRFYDLQGGRILVDGQDIADVSAASLRAQMAYVSQAPILFQGTVAENLRHARPSATETELVEAARLAQAHEFIAKLPEGYDTPLGENGANLSGGQRQRLSIARAILRDAPILLLDEATSALDNESEARVQAALDTLMEGRTTIVVAHRLSTIRNADRIVVIENGRAVDQGSHGDLMSRDTAYRRFQGYAGGDKVVPLEQTHKDKTLDKTRKERTP